MRLFRSSEILGIAAETLSFALDAAADTHPDEYMGLLRGEPARDLGLDRDGTVITDVLVIPGTRASPRGATFQSNLVPNDLGSLGSVHSHPNGVLEPSDTDVASFGRGKVHVIMGAPYGRDDWRAFDRDGQPAELDVLDVDLPDPAERFFDFDEADLDL
ncbi:MAG: Mov34/MPN/PAD-1 family protein [Halobacteriales archaeon]